MPWWGIIIIIIFIIPRSRTLAEQRADGEPSLSALSCVALEPECTCRQ